MNRTLYLFDVDGTIAESSKTISTKAKNCISTLMLMGFHVGIVGGGKMDKIITQLDGLTFNHYFSECGCVYYKSNNKTLEQVYVKNIRDHVLYPKINIIVKEAMKFIANVDYLISGHFIDLRNGIIYISLVGMCASNDERANYIRLDEMYGYRDKLLLILGEKAKDIGIYDGIEMVAGGSVGIALYPTEYNKVQVIVHLYKNYDTIHYFGDKYKKDGNDYKLLNHPLVIGHSVNTVEDTEKILDGICDIFN